MSIAKNREASFTYQAARLKRKSFKHNADVHISGDVAVEGMLIVGGNLTVQGSLRTGELYCCGQVTVKGNLFAQNVYVGHGIDADGDIGVTFKVKTGCDLETIYYLSSPFRAKPFEETDNGGLAHEDVLERLDEEKQHLAGGPAIVAGGYLYCDLLDAHAAVELGGELDAGDVERIDGWLTARNIYCESDVNVYGSIHAEEDIDVAGALFTPGDLSCGGNILYAGSIAADQGIDARGYILAQGDITASKDIQAGRWIAAKGEVVTDTYIKAGECIVGERGVRAGKDYGIFAGMCVSRSEWKRHGYVSSKAKPRNILAGEFVPRRTLKYVEAREEKRDWLYDWEEIRKMKYDLAQQRAADAVPDTPL